LEKHFPRGKANWRSLDKQNEHFMQIKSGINLRTSPRHQVVPATKVTASASPVALVIRLLSAQPDRPARQSGEPSLVSRLITRLFFVTFFLLLFSSNTQALALYDRVSATGTLNVRDVAAGNQIATEYAGNKGFIIGGPVTATYLGTSYVWWEVSWDNYLSGGWSIANTMQTIPSWELDVYSSNPNSGVTISVSPIDVWLFLGSGTTDTLVPTGFWRIYDNNVLVTLTAPATAGGNNFVQWNRNGSFYSSSQTTTVTMNADYSMTAVYGCTLPGFPGSPNPANGATVSSQPTILDWSDASYAKSYDVYLDGTFRANVSSSQWTLNQSLTLATHNWYVIAKNSCGQSSGPPVVWSFTISPPPTVTITSPNGGENWQVGSSHNITASVSGSITGWQLEYSTDGGSSWNWITGMSTANTTINVSWTVPDVPSTTCKIRATVLYANGSVADASDANFTISQPIPTVTVTSPNGGENWQVGSSHNITATSSGSITSVEIDYSTDGGSSWAYITAYSPLNNTINVSWTVPNTPSTTAKVRVIVGYSGGSVADVSDANFTISQPPTLVVSSVTPTAVQTEDWGQSVVYTITVTDSIGNPVSGATVGGDDNVRIVSYTTSPNTTDANGHINYTTTVPNGEANGTYNITFVATKLAYNMSSSVTRQVQVQHIPTSFGGTVTDSSTGSPIFGATVTWGGYSATTAANGTYSINNITCGTATLTVSKNGYQTYSQDYTPTCNASSVMSISLTAGLSGTVIRSGNYDTTIYPVSIQKYPISGIINPNQRTWLIIHGRGSSRDASNITNLCQAIAANRPSDQVLTLDWRAAAIAPGIAGDADFLGADAIVNVATWAVSALQNYGFTGVNLNLVGHSWGGCVAAEMAQRTSAQINTIVALDPAEATPFVPPFYDTEGASVDFSKAGYSWAFHSSYYGSEQTPTTANEAFRVIDNSGDSLKQHNDVPLLFSYMVQHSTGISALFQLDRLLNYQSGPWVPNQFDSLGIQNGVLGYPGYEGVIFTAADGQSPDTIEYVPTTPEITALGNGISIADGDTTPSSTDGTDFGSVTQGQAGPTHTFTVRNDGGSALTLGSVSVPSGFILDVGLPTSLAPGASDSFTVRLDTTSVGTKSGQISFSNNDSDENPFNFSIAGTVTTLPTVATPTISPNGGSYSGSVQVTLACSTSGAFIYYTTDGNDPTTSSTSYEGPFTLTTSVAVKAKAFESGYNPSATASANFTITPTPTRIISLSGNLAFGSVAVGSSPQSILTIYNTGNSTMTMSSISYPNGFSGSWSGTIAANGSQPVTVTFSPTAATSYGGTVTVNSDATSGGNTIAASGTGTATAQPAMINPTPGSTLTSSSATFQWSSGTGVSDFFLYVGKSFGANDIYGQDQGLNLSTTVNSLPTDGSTLYIRLYWQISGVWNHADYTYTAEITPTMTSPTPGSTLTFSSAIFQWSSGTGVSDYFLYVGKSVGTNDIYGQDQGLNLSTTVNSLPTDGSTLYVRLYWQISGAWYAKDYTYTAYVISPTRIITLSGNLAFGNVTVGNSSQTTLMIANTGNSTITVSSISFPNGFSGSWSGTIAAGGSQPVTVTFSPVSATSYSGIVTVNSDETSGVNTINASGTGTTTPAQANTVFYDDFADNVIDSNKWTISGNTVVEASQMMQVLTTVTDQPGALTSKPFAIANSGLITITREVFLHHNDSIYYLGNNHFFTGQFAITVTNVPQFNVDYYDYDYSSSGEKPTYGFYITRNGVSAKDVNQQTNVSSGITALWDTWFSEKITYDPRSGQVQYYTNNSLQITFNVGVMPVVASPKMSLFFQAYGWWTGHEQLFSDLVVSQAIAPPPPQLTGISISINKFIFTLNGPAGSNYVIQASSNIVNWVNLSTNAIPTGGMQGFSILILTNQPEMFYRAVPSQ
jgi:pimeloyl-ACP methyl ester carboxylesterase